MLGFIAYLVAGYMGGEDADHESLRRECMPWINETEISAAGALEAIKRGDK